MKKLITYTLLIALLVTLCACGKENGAEANTSATLDPQSPEAMYGHIDQTQAVDGVYKIWNAEGVKFMMENPGNSYELLCNVDMGGAILKPMGTASGSINGGNFVISNFTLQGEEEVSFGFITENKGKIRDLRLENATFMPGAKASQIGTLVGNNAGELLRCYVTGSMLVEAAAENASIGALVGTNTGSMRNMTVTVDLHVTAQTAAIVGGIVGTTQGGVVEHIDTLGALDIAGTNKTAGLFAGFASDVVLTECAFVGASNTLDGKLFTNFTGNEDDEMVTVVGGLRRDNAAHQPLTENQQKLRDRVVEEMYKMGTVRWTVKQDLPNFRGSYSTLYTYYGMPYNHMSSSLTRFNYCVGEDRVMKDWVYETPPEDGYDAYVGNDCSTSVLHAWFTVSNSVDFMRCTYMLPQYTDVGGCLKVGEYNSDFALPSTNYTEIFLLNNDEQTIYEAYAKLRKGDAYVHIPESGGHARMAAEDAVVVRDQNGLINPAYSYVISHEHGVTTVDDVNMTKTTWRVNYKYTFANLYEKWSIPVTCEELVTGEMEAPTCELQNSVDGKAGMTTGLVQANYYLTSVRLVIKDSGGNEVFNHVMFPTVGKLAEDGHWDANIRVYCDDYDLGFFAAPLQETQLKKGETYSYTVTAALATDDVFILKEDSFVNGN